jgi:carbon-monoxide dehydrogenase large subunit
MYEMELLATKSPNNPLGAKGVGEFGCVTAPPAIVNAVLDALAPLGVTKIDMPLTSEKVWQAIQAAKA